MRVSDFGRWDYFLEFCKHLKTTANKFLFRNWRVQTPREQQSLMGRANVLPQHWHPWLCIMMFIRLFWSIVQGKELYVIFLRAPSIVFFCFCLRSIYWRGLILHSEILLYFSLQHPLHTWMVTHPSANHGPSCLTSVILWELVLRNRQTTLLNKTMNHYPEVQTNCLWNSQYNLSPMEMVWITPFWLSQRAHYGTG